ncbi:hypothetical protein KC573_04445, partial [candidate division WWE3 bacterium]|nr:hypothetical protein [candidate division WWE3 bacterium]
MKKLLILIGVILSLGIVVMSPMLVRGDELSDLEKQLQDTRAQIAENEKKLQDTAANLEQAKQQVQYYQGSLQTLSGQLAYAQSQLAQTKIELEQHKLEIAQVQAKIEENRLNAAYQQQLLATTVRKVYMSNFFDEVTVLLTDPDVQNVSFVLAYRQSVADSYRLRLGAIVDTLTNAENKEATLLAEQESLGAAEQSLQAQQVAIEQQIANAQSQLATTQSRQQSLTSSLTGIQKSLSSLTQKEQEILAAKAAAALASTTVGNEEIYKSAIEKDPPATGTYFSFWTYGYPHRVGMNQYGAYGR